MGSRINNDRAQYDIQLITYEFVHYISVSLSLPILRTKVGNKTHIDGNSPSEMLISTGGDSI